MMTSLSNNCSVYCLYNNAICGRTYDSIIIDIRDECEYNKSHIINAINITTASLNKSDLKTILKSHGISSWSINSIYIHRNEDEIQTKLIHKLSTINPNAHIYIMNAGFDAFQNKFPFLCTQNEDQTTYTTQTTNYPSQIINDKLFIGNIESGRNKNILQQLGITHIVNATADIPCYHQSDNKLNIKYLQIFVDDHVNEDISIYFEETTRFIHNTLNEKDKENNNRVLVHCRQGISRSSAFVIAYLMRYNNQSFFEAEKYVKDRRNVIGVNDGFVTRLLQFEELLRKQQAVTQITIVNKYTLTLIGIAFAIVVYHYLNKSKL